MLWTMEGANQVTPPKTENLLTSKRWQDHDSMGSDIYIRAEISRILAYIV